MSLWIHFQFTRAGDDPTIRYEDDFKLNESEIDDKANRHAAASETYNFIINKEWGAAI